MRISVNDVFQGRAYGAGDEWDSPTWSIKARARVRRLPPDGASLYDFIDFCLGVDFAGATSWDLDTDEGKANYVSYLEAIFLAERTDEGRVSLLGATDHTDVINMDRFFLGFTQLEELDLAFLEGVLIESMWSAFRDCHALRRLDLSPLDTSQVENMGCAFHSCYGLEAIDLSMLDTSRVRHMECLLKGCLSLRSVNLTGLDTSQVEDMRQLFLDCQSLREVDLSGLDTAHVRDMSHLFHWCASLEHVDLAGLDTSRATSLWSMFDGCRSLRALDLSGLDTSRVEKAGCLLRGCSSLEELALPGMPADVRAPRLFEGCTSLRRWSAPAAWPVERPGFVPVPTAECGMWWSERAGAWMSVAEIAARGAVADTYLAEPGQAR